jgi:hypothetical protein
MIPLVHKFQCTFFGLFRRHFHFHAYLLRDKTVRLGKINFTFFPIVVTSTLLCQILTGCLIEERLKDSPNAPESIRLDLPFVNRDYV